PAVERLEALLAAVRAAAAVPGAIGAGGVPGHADEERAVMAVVGRPPGLRGGQDLADVRLDGVEVEGGEFLRIVVVGAIGVGPRLILSQSREVEVLGPPVLLA